jgi:hypothetical protein
LDINGQMFEHFQYVQTQTPLLERLFCKYVCNK